MRETLTSNPELFSDISWNLLLLGEETAKKWDHSEFNIEHIIHTLFTSSDFYKFIEKLSIDQDIVLDITEDFLEETPINESDIFTIGEDLEILLDNANQIKIQWGSKFIEIRIFPLFNLLKIIFSTLIMSFVLYYGINFFEDKLIYTNNYKSIYLLFMIGLVATIYLISCYLFGLLKIKNYKTN